MGGSTKEWRKLRRQKANKEERGMEGERELARQGK